MLSVVPTLAEAGADAAICTTDSMTLTLPVPPSINAQYATVQGRRVLSATGRAYKDYVAQRIMVAFARAPQRNQLRAALHQSLLTLSIHFQFGAPMRRDLDGGLKITQDAVCEALGLNDNRIVELHLSKQPLPPADHPRITVILRAISPLAAGTS
jgi:crossover junction endodeoxyribonuclease RusA